MAFKHLDSRQVSDAQWDHVESLGVRTSYNEKKFDRSWEEMTVDEERGYYLVLRGITSPNFDGSDRVASFYALCLEDDVFLFDVRQDGSGDLSDKTYRTCWHINSIDFPADWSFDRLSVDEFKRIVTEAFIGETIQGAVTAERIKKIGIEFPENFVDKICDREKRNKDNKK